MNTRERLAAYAHESWAGWIRYQWSLTTLNADGTRTIPKDSVDRWSRQSVTSYSQLPEGEKESDRQEADKIADASLSQDFTDTVLDVYFSKLPKDNDRWFIGMVSK